MLSTKLLSVVSLALAVTAPSAAASSLRVRVHAKDDTCGDGQQSIGVSGWDHDGCVDSGYICVADVSDGDCPDGAYCDLLDTGVWGCKDGAPPTESGSYTEGCGDGEQTIGVAGWDHDGCIASDYVCVAEVSDGDCPEGAYCALLDTGVYGCTAGDYDDGDSTEDVIWYGDDDTSYSAGCADGEQTIGVAGWDHDGCIASDYVCVAEVSDGDCPKGAFCALLETGVYGCTAGTDDTEDTGYTDDDGTCGDGEQTIGVVGWDHDGCIDSDNVCVAQVSDGDCPEGTYCTLLDTGVYGCQADALKKHHKKHHHKKHHSKSSVTCSSGQESIGVAGWSNDGCVTSGNVCVANTNGDCPAGAHCEWLDTGVYGCADGAEESTPWVGCSGNEQTIGVVGWDQDGCIDSDYVCVAQVSDGDCPEGAYCTLLDTGVYGCQADALKKHHKKHHHKKHHSKSSVTCSSGQESIGVAGWSNDGCVTSGNVCVANTNGDCPAGAHCEWLDTGVYGCADGAEESTPWVGCSGNEQTIGVVGWDQDGCIDSDYVCVAQVSDGDCPEGAYCTLLDTGVYGCQADALKKHHKKHHKSHKSHS